ncbi:hypothetical protein [Alicyclobacillus acidiphilus]|uniref:hypothetical protein n=1 Tax=Alicyclobacillus acidiphilus TaxID=182455 RepID=UPI000A733BCF|nr:hypothetical protein [Alicyclobacillus acidiphilus]
MGKGVAAIRVLSRVTRALLTLLTVAILFVFNYELVGIVAFRYFYPAPSSIGETGVLGLHCALAALLTIWLYKRFFHVYLWR